MKDYRAIGLYCKVFILLEKRPKIYKVKAKTESKKLLIVLRSKTYLVYIFIKNIVIKTPFIKLYEFKNLLILEGVSKLIGIRPLNDVVVTEDFIEKRILLDLLKIDNIGSLEFITFEVPRSLEFLPLGPFKFLKFKNKPLEPVFKPPEELIKPMDSLDPDEI